MTVPPPLSPDEPIRLAALRRLNVIETPIEERFERITRMAQRLLGVRQAVISLVEADREWYKSVQGSDACQGSRDESFCGHAVLQDEPFIVEDARLDPRFADNPHVTRDVPATIFYAGVPVHAPDGSRIGMMCIKDDKPRKVGADEVETLRDLAALAETELRTAGAARTQAALVAAAGAEQRKGMIDALTRVWNRQGITEVAERALRDAGESPWGAALVAVDLDAFKPINDTLGHPAGDEVLRVAAKRMLGAVRETDVVGRVGGDEFLLVLTPCQGRAEAVAVAERVRARLAESAVPTPAGPARLTACVGVAFVGPGERAGFDATLEAADRALYESKGEGRDRVGVAA